MRDRKYIHETHIISDAFVPVIYHPCMVKQSCDGLPNWHENIEFLCFYKGEGEIRLDTKCFKIRQGDIAIVNPEVMHQIVSDDTVEYHCLIVDKSFCEENAIDIFSLEFKEIIRDERLFSSFKSLIEKIEALDSQDISAFKIPEARHALLGFLILLCKEHLTKASSSKELKASSSERVKAVMLYLQDRIDEPITLDDVSRHIGISKYHLSREFKSYTGKTMFDYLNTIRCTDAKRMLREGYTVSEAAAACGFESLSYFSRCFKKYIGERPSKYAKKLI